MASSFSSGKKRISSSLKTKGCPWTPPFPLEMVPLSSNVIEKTREKTESRKTRWIWSRGALEYIGIEFMNLELINQEVSLQWKQGGGTHIFIEENPLVHSWCCMPLVELQHIQTSRQRMGSDSTIWVVATKLETLASSWKIRQAPVFSWIMALHPHHLLGIRVKHLSFMTLLSHILTSIISAWHPGCALIIGHGFTAPPSPLNFQI